MVKQALQGDISAYFQCSGYFEYRFHQRNYRVKGVFGNNQSRAFYYLFLDRLQTPCCGQNYNSAWCVFYNYSGCVAQRHSSKLARAVLFIPLLAIRNDVYSETRNFYHHYFKPFSGLKYLFDYGWLAVCCLRQPINISQIKYFNPKNSSELYFLAHTSSSVCQ